MIKATRETLEKDLLSSQLRQSAVMSSHAEKENANNQNLMEIDGISTAVHGMNPGAPVADEKQLYPHDSQRSTRANTAQGEAVAESGSVHDDSERAEGTSPGDIDVWEQKLRDRLNRLKDRLAAQDGEVQEQAGAPPPRDQLPEHDDDEVQPSNKAQRLQLDSGKALRRSWHAMHELAIDSTMPDTGRMPEMSEAVKEQHEHGHGHGAPESDGAREEQHAAEMQSDSAPEQQRAHAGELREPSSEQAQGQTTPQTPETRQADDNANVKLYHDRMEPEYETSNRAERQEQRVGDEGTGHAGRREEGASPVDSLDSEGKEQHTQQASQRDTDRDPQQGRMDAPDNRAVDSVAQDHEAAMPEVTMEALSAPDALVASTAPVISAIDSGIASSGGSAAANPAARSPQLASPVADAPPSSQLPDTHDAAAAAHDSRAFARMGNMNVLSDDTLNTDQIPGIQAERTHREEALQSEPRDASVRGAGQVSQPAVKEIVEGEQFLELMRKMDTGRTQVDASDKNIVVKPMYRNAHDERVEKGVEEETEHERKVRRYREKQEQTLQRQRRLQAERERARRQLASAQKREVTGDEGMRERAITSAAQAQVHRDGSDGASIASQLDQLGKIKSNSALYEGPQQDAEWIRSTANLESVLSPLLNQCFRRDEGWWTYQICHGQTVTQFHEDHYS
jgi:hypothetical protein